LLGVLIASNCGLGWTWFTSFYIDGYAFLCKQRFGLGSISIIVCCRLYSLLEIVNWVSLKFIFYCTHYLLFSIYKVMLIYVTCLFICKYNLSKSIYKVMLIYVTCLFICKYNLSKSLLGLDWHMYGLLQSLPWWCFPIDHIKSNNNFLGSLVHCFHIWYIMENISVI